MCISAPMNMAVQGVVPAGLMKVDLLCVWRSARRSRTVSEHAHRGHGHGLRVRVDINRFRLVCACRRRALPIVNISPSAINIPRNHADRAIELKGPSMTTKHGTAHPPRLRPGQPHSATDPDQGQCLSSRGARVALRVGLRRRRVLRSWSPTARSACQVANDPSGSTSSVTIAGKSPAPTRATLTFAPTVRPCSVSSRAFNEWNSHSAHLLRDHQHWLAGADVLADLGGRSRLSNTISCPQARCRTVFSSRRSSTASAEAAALTCASAMVRCSWVGPATAGLGVMTSASATSASAVATSFCAWSEALLRSDVVACQLRCAGELLLRVVQPRLRLGNRGYVRGEFYRAHAGINVVSVRRGGGQRRSRLLDGSGQFEREDGFGDDVAGASGFTFVHLNGRKLAADLSGSGISVVRTTPRRSAPPRGNAAAGIQPHRPRREVTERPRDNGYGPAIAMCLSPLDQERGYYRECEIDGREDPKATPVARHLPQARAHWSMRTMPWMRAKSEGNM